MTIEFGKIYAASPGAGWRSQAMMNGQLGDLGSRRWRALSLSHCTFVPVGASCLRPSSARQKVAAAGSGAQSFAQAVGARTRAYSHGFVLSLAEAAGLRRPGAVRALLEAPQSLAGRQGARELGHQDAALASKILFYTPRREGNIRMLRQAAVIKNLLQAYNLRDLREGDFFLWLHPWGRGIMNILYSSLISYVMAIIKTLESGIFY